MDSALFSREPSSEPLSTPAQAVNPCPAPVSVGNQFPLQGELNVVPQRCVVREISFLMDSDGLQFLYRDPTPGFDLEGPDIDPVVQPLIGTSFPAALGLTGAGLGSAETPLDLGLAGGRGPAFLVFKLDRRLNWRFSRALPAVTHKNGADSAHYGGLTYVSDGGAYSREPMADCRLVFFKANPPTEDYRHGFNFNVELIQRPHFGEVEARVLPITIDPDIRFPGGSES
jgi:hypothetical protein